MDNDLDMLIDYPQDNGCSGPDDPSEEPQVPVTGPPAALLLVGVLVATGIVRARRRIF